VAIVVVTGLLALMSQLNGPLKRAPQTAAITPPKPPVPSPSTAQVPQAPLPDTPSAEAGPGGVAAVQNGAAAVPKRVDVKPSPMPPPEPAAESKAGGLDNEPARTSAPAARVSPDQSADEPVNRAIPGAPRRSTNRIPPAQPVRIVTSPPGATATMDGQVDVSCTTPCYLDAPPGRHTIAVTMSGYEIEHREIDIGSSPYELPAVVLRPPGSTLYLRSVPAGASISINGKKFSEVTPARIPLPPGTYNVTVEKNGKQNTQSVEVQNGKLNLVKIPLE
jgi:hypothetical protein